MPIYIEQVKQIDDTYVVKVRYATACCKKLFDVIVEPGKIPYNATTFIDVPDGDTRQLVLDAVKAYANTKH